MEVGDRDSRPPFENYSRDKLSILWDDIEEARVAIIKGYGFLIGYLSAVQAGDSDSFLASHRGEFTQANIRLKPAIESIAAAIGSKRPFTWDRQLFCSDDAEQVVIQQWSHRSYGSSHPEFETYAIEPLRNALNKSSETLDRIKAGVQTQLQLAPASGRVGDCRLEVDFDEFQIRLDGIGYAANEQGCIYIDALIQAPPGVFIGSGEISSKNEDFDSTNVTRTRKHLPEKVQQLVEAQSGLGSRLKDAAWNADGS